MTAARWQSPLRGSKNWRDNTPTFVVKHLRMKDDTIT